MPKNCGDTFQLAQIICTFAFNLVDHSSVCKVQNLSCKITKQQSHLALDTHNDVEDTFLESSEIKKGELKKGFLHVTIFSYVVIMLLCCITIMTI